MFCNYVLGWYLEMLAFLSEHQKATENTLAYVFNISKTLKTLAGYI